MLFRSLSCALIASAALITSVQAAEPSGVRPWVKEQLPSLVKLYQHFHQHPELSFMERETAASLAKEWESAGFKVTTGVGGHGVVAMLKNGDGPLLMLRADMDALPVTEQTELVYASKVKVKDQAGVEVGVMHACGHDIHVTNMIGVARFLGSHKDLWQGTLMLVGQPAEERGLGAQAMLDDKLFDRFGKPDFAMALHVFPDLPAGAIGYRAGYAMANVDSVDIVVKGKGGHGAYPHATIDPIVQAAELVMSLQTIVSREIKPIEPAVVTVGSIHGGTKHNIIGNECRLQITIRSYSDEVHEQIIVAIKRKANAIAQAYNAPPPEIKIGEGTPALFNDEKLTARIGTVLEQVVGKENLRASEASMGGEDFGRFGRAGVPILMFNLGALDGKRLTRLKELGQAPPSLHSAVFYPDDVELTLATGVTAMTSAALEILKK
ncbi:MAG TPA: amidohydrolase [Pirellulaceae bacterium]|nr:amidohydrolase [Pirellulaceae bacterium]